MHKKFRYYFFSLLFLFSCDIPEEKPAEVAEAKEIEKPAKKEAVATTSYSIRPAESEVNWVGSKPTGKHYGSLGIKSGIIEVYNDSVVSGKVIIDMDDIEVADLRSDEDSHMKLTEHLKSSDFFDVENFPFARFEITSAKPFELNKAEESQYDFKEGNKAPTHLLTGNLTLKGKTLSLTFPAYLDITKGKISGTAKFSIDRTLWGVKHREEAQFKDKAQDKLIYNNVDIELQLLANPENQTL